MSENSEELTNVVDAFGNLIYRDYRVIFSSGQPATLQKGKVTRMYQWKSHDPERRYYFYVCITPDSRPDQKVIVDNGLVMVDLLEKINGGHRRFCNFIQFCGEKCNCGLITYGSTTSGADNGYGAII